MTIKTNDPLVEQFAQTFARLVVDLSRFKDTTVSQVKTKSARKPRPAKPTARRRK